MHVLILGYSPSPLEDIVRQSGCTVSTTNAPLDKDNLQHFDFIVSYGYRHIITEDILEIFPSKIINLHISYLPWNRGADPNLWSFLEDTPKGFTIHHMDMGVDTGDIIYQEEVEMSDRETLSTSYRRLQEAMILAFKTKWPDIMAGKVDRKRQDGQGSYHRLADKAAYAHLWQERGWDTPVGALIGKAIK